MKIKAKVKSIWPLIVGLLAASVFAAAAAGCAGNAGNGNENGNANESGNAATAVQSLTPEEAKGMMDSGDRVFVVDVRTAEEYAEKHIPNAILLPNEEIGEELPFGLPRDEAILVYCRSGNRSRAAAEKLMEMGYTQVYDFGGIDAWSFETETDAYEEPAALTGLFGKFTTTELKGYTVTADILRHYDLTVLNVWGTYCGPCIREMPALGELAEEYENVQIVGIVIDTTDYSGAIVEAQLDTAASIIKDTGAQYLHLLPSTDLNTLALNTIYSIPTTLFLNSNGDVLKTAVGSMTKARWIAEINVILKEMGV